LCDDFLMKLPEIMNVSLISIQGFCRYSTATEKDFKEIAPLLAGVHNLSFSLKTTADLGPIEALRFFGTSSNLYFHHVNETSFLVVETKKDIREGMIKVMVNVLIQKLQKFL
jgi:predicted regulator of Ras-like GTPase activity (Roadblock/LC7/MglB family)